MATCPKCQSSNVFVRETGVGWDLYLHVMATVQGGLVGDAMVPTAEWRTYLCTDCGYFENYVTDNDWLQKIKAGRWEKWHKAE